LFKQETMFAADKMFEVANIAHEIKKEEQEIYRDFIKNTSNFDD